MTHCDAIRICFVKILVCWLCDSVDESHYNPLKWWTFCIKYFAIQSQLPPWFRTANVRKSTSFALYLERRPLPIFHVLAIFSDSKSYIRRNSLYIKFVVVRIELVPPLSKNFLSILDDLWPPHWILLSHLKQGNDVFLTYGCPQSHRESDELRMLDMWSGYLVGQDQRFPPKPMVHWECPSVVEMSSYAVCVDTVCVDSRI